MVVVLRLILTHHELQATQRSTGWAPSSHVSVTPITPATTVAMTCNDHRDDHCQTTTPTTTTKPLQPYRREKGMRNKLKDHVTRETESVCVCLGGGGGVRVFCVYVVCVCVSVRV